MLKLITTKKSLSNRTKGSKFCGFESDSGGGVVAETWYRLLLAVSLICIRTADYQLQSLEYICIYMFLFLFFFFYIFLSLNFYTSCEIICVLFPLSCQSNFQFLAQRMQQMTVLFRERRCKLQSGPTKMFKDLICRNHNCNHFI